MDDGGWEWTRVDDMDEKGRMCTGICSIVLYIRSTLFSYHSVIPSTRWINLTPTRCNRVTRSGCNTPLEHVTGAALSNHGMFQRLLETEQDSLLTTSLAAERESLTPKTLLKKEPDPTELSHLHLQSVEIFL